MGGPPKLPAQRKRQPGPNEILAVNLSVPGWGTMQAGHKVLGCLQLAIASTGFVLTLYFGAWFLLEWNRSGVLPMQTLLQTGVLPGSWVRPLIVGGVGVLFFVVAIVWAFITSLMIRDRLKRENEIAAEHR